MGSSKTNVSAPTKTPFINSAQAGHPSTVTNKIITHHEPRGHISAKTDRVHLQAVLYPSG